MTDCATFERLLERLLAEEATGDERSLAGEHLDGCAACSELAALLLEDRPVDPSLDLTAAVIDRTSGSACTRARRLLTSLPDGTLQSLDRELLAEHTGACEACSTYGAVLARLSEDLPLLASADPGPRFVESVVARTSGRRSDPARWSPTRWAQWLRRPRFAWELAFVASALLWFAVLAPHSPLHVAPERTLARLRPAIGELGEVGRIVELPHRGAIELSRRVDSAAGHGRRGLSRIREDLEVRALRTEPARASMRRETRELGSALGRGDLEAGIGALRSLGGGLGTLLRQFASNPVQPDGGSEMRPPSESVEPEASDTRVEQRET